MMAPVPSASGSNAGRYVVLRHQWPADRRDEPGRSDHYDWMFEFQGLLLTWASERFSPPDQAARLAAKLLPPHRLIYLNYEGAVSGGRGTVRRIEAGAHQLLQQTANRYEFSVRGDRCGWVTIYRTASSEPWWIAFEPKRDGRPARADAS